MNSKRPDSPIGMSSVHRTDLRPVRSMVSFVLMVMSAPFNGMVGGTSIVHRLWADTHRKLPDITGHEAEAQ